METFTATIQIIGINPYVLLPEPVLQSIFDRAQKSKGPIPVRGTIDGHPFIQTLVKYSAAWRLYVNMPMLKASGKKVGDEARFELEFDPEERTVPIHPKLEKALAENSRARATFNGLPPSRQKGIIRYISFLKTEESVDRNVHKAIDFLLGKARFVGRDKP